MWIPEKLLEAGGKKFPAILFHKKTAPHNQDPIIVGPKKRKVPTFGNSILNFQETLSWQKLAEAKPKQKKKKNWPSRMNLVLIFVDSFKETSNHGKVWGRWIFS